MPRKPVEIIYIETFTPDEKAMEAGWRWLLNKAAISLGAEKKAKAGEPVSKDHCHCNMENNN